LFTSVQYNTYYTGSLNSKFFYFTKNVLFYKTLLCDTTKDLIKIIFHVEHSSMNEYLTKYKEKKFIILSAWLTL